VKIIEHTRRLLAVLAHPDDESFGPGGTLALYANNGVEVFLVCATRGEAGEVDEDCLDGFKSIAERREYELRCASQHLGLKGVFFLGYHDSGMPGSSYNQHPDSMLNHSEEEIAGKVVDYIRLLKPQVVITFDPIGGYRHPDHIAIHNATVRAFYAAGNNQPAATTVLKMNPLPGTINYVSDDGGVSPAYITDTEPFEPQKLYYQTIPKRILRLAVRILPLFRINPHHFGRNKDIDLVSLSSEEFPTHAIIDYRSVLKQRTEASRCHDSQGGGNMTRGIGGLVRRSAGNRDYFMRAYPPMMGSTIERDLFANVD